MEQLNIFNELGFIEDPIYLKLLVMNELDEINIEGIVVFKNILGMYEISSDELHEGFKDLDNCYKKLMQNLSPLSRVFN